MTSDHRIMRYHNLVEFKKNLDCNESLYNKNFNQRNPLSLEAEGFSLPPFYPLPCHVDVERQLHEAFQSLVYPLHC
ncbi:hypothetical protein T10_13178 [Trichinella papuae]|uniref:Uncharacterized protein n=1 Tax=Trichinella papuae TaxID=268474 RepID=A0A0V1MXQ2_9BILA|nr:hypothetical protein T10_13178 [Trichinella papuae]